MIPAFNKEMDAYLWIVFSFGEHPAAPKSYLRSEGQSTFFKVMKAQLAAFAGSIWIILLLSAATTLGQQASQNPSPMTDTTRPHPRIEKTEVRGRRIPLSSLKGAVLFAGDRVRAEKPVPLIIHFHGAQWLMEYHIARHFPKAALITVNLGSGSRVYGEPFTQSETFQTMIDEAAEELQLKKDWSSITLVGFSAGYGSIRAILRQPEYFRKVDNVLLLDGIHASYVPEGKRLADGGVIKADDLDSYVSFAREAVAGRKGFVISHSEIFPGTYASTTECVDYLLSSLGLKRVATLKGGPAGMQQLSEVNAKRFRIFGYAGNTGADHGDQLQAMPYWLKVFDIKLR